MTRLLICSAVVLLLFVGYKEWNRRQVEPSHASVSLSPPPPTLPSNSPAEVQPSQPTEPAEPIQTAQPARPTIAVSLPDQQSPPPRTSKAAVADRKLDGQAAKQKLSRYEIPFEAYEGTARRIIISVRFNDSVTAPMIIDTGAPGMVISPKLAEELGVFRSDEGKLWVTAGGIGGSVPAIRTIIDKAQVGGATDRFIPTTVTRSISGSFEGLIGMDFMGKYSMQIDSIKKVVVFEEIPPDPSSPGGRDEQWWRNIFKEFTSHRDTWLKYADFIDKQIRDNPLAQNVGGGLNADTFKKVKEIADYQYTEADRLLSKLERYANEYSVPRQWRSY